MKLFYCPNCLNVLEVKDGKVQYCDNCPSFGVAKLSGSPRGLWRKARKSDIEITKLNKEE